MSSIKDKANIAIMIIAHKNEDQINRLIKHLSKDFDIYVHIDVRSSLSINKLKNVYVYKKYKAYWGSFNLIMVTIHLLEKAFNRGYERYILISGQDLPIKTNREIKLLFLNNNSEYLDIEKIPTQRGWPNMNRLTKYYPNHSNGKIYNKEILGLKPRKLDYEFYGGSQWTNYTHNCVKRILEYLENNRKYINRFMWTLCADEIFFQTIINQLSGLEITNDCLRYINWIDGPESPRILRKVDYARIVQSGAIFARKFDDKVDKKIIEMIYEKIE